MFFNIFFLTNFFIPRCEAFIRPTIHTEGIVGVAEDIFMRKAFCAVFFIPYTASIPGFFHAVFPHKLWLSAGLVKSDPCASRNHGVYGGFKCLVLIVHQRCAVIKRCSFKRRPHCHSELSGTYWAPDGLTCEVELTVWTRKPAGVSSIRVESNYQS